MEIKFLKDSDKYIDEVFDKSLKLRYNECIQILKGLECKLYNLILEMIS
jgi:hypothetical protein